MYVCHKCNSLVEQPKKRWWSGWRYCPNGHVLYVRGLGAALEESFWKSLLEGFVPSICVFCLIVLTLAVAPDYPPNLRAHAGSAAASLGLLVAIFYSFWGLSLLRKAHVWSGREGPVQRLVPHAKGRAYGFLAAVACQLGIVIALLFAK
jgi:hypothetical protein